MVWGKLVFYGVLWICILSYFVKYCIFIYLFIHFFNGFRQIQQHPSMKKTPPVTTWPIPTTSHTTSLRTRMRWLQQRNMIGSVLCYVLHPLSRFLISRPSGKSRSLSKVVRVSWTTFGSIKTMCAFDFSSCKELTLASVKYNLGRCWLRSCVLTSVRGGGHRLVCLLACLIKLAFNRDTFCVVLQCKILFPSL